MGGSVWRRPLLHFPRVASCSKTCTEACNLRCGGASGRSPDTYYNVDAASILCMTVGVGCKPCGRLGSSEHRGRSGGRKVDLVRCCAGFRGLVTQPGSLSSESMRADEIGETKHRGHRESHIGTGATEVSVVSITALYKSNHCYPIFHTQRPVLKEIKPLQAHFIPRGQFRFEGPKVQIPSERS